jgi:hypothetical protein
MRNLIRKILKEGFDDSWESEGKKITLRELLDVTKDIPVINVPTSKLKNIVLNWEGNSEEIEKIEVSDLQYPILIFVDDNNKIKCIIDGNHRVQKALKHGLKTIKTKLIKFSELPEDFKQVFK